MVEIERKFLVRNTNFKAQAESTSALQQGFLSIDPERTVRVRIFDSLGFLTVKGKSNASGTTRMEWEHQISKQEAQSLLDLCLPGIIDKDRYTVKHGAHCWEVDVFKGENAGLIVAEVELLSESEAFIKPPWLGEEVTGQSKYYNSQLSTKPYTTW